MFFVAINKFHVASFLDNEIISVVALCLIIGQINIKNRILNLETNVFDFLGKISYGIYVIHPLLIFFCTKLLGNLQMNLVCKYIIVYSAVLIVTILLAHLSYKYFEKYFLNFKDKFVVIKSYGTKNHP